MRINEIIRPHLDHINPNDRIVMTTNDNIVFQNKEQVPVSRHKPNGLWYAIGTEWIDWVKTEMPSWEYDHLFKIDINPSKMLMITTENELNNFAKQYAGDEYGISWKDVSQHYSGIEISPYQWKCRLTIDWYYTWDIASGCIWNRDAIASITKIDEIFDK